MSSFFSCKTQLLTLARSEIAMVRGERTGGRNKQQSASSEERVSRDEDL